MKNSGDRPVIRRRRKKGPGLTRQVAADMLDVPVAVVDQMIADNRLTLVRLGPNMERIPTEQVAIILEEFGSSVSLRKEKAPVHPQASDRRDE